jgi:hypothetical protein
MRVDRERRGQADPADDQASRTQLMCHDVPSQLPVTMDTAVRRCPGGAFFGPHVAFRSFGLQKGARTRTHLRERGRTCTCGCFATASNCDTFARFVAYTRTLNWFLPGPVAPTLAIVATCAETVLGILLLLGWQTRTTAALLRGGLLLLFALTMAGALGIKAPLDASVFSAAGEAFLLADCAEYPFSIDQLRRDSARST